MASRYSFVLARAVYAVSSNQNENQTSINSHHLGILATAAAAFGLKLGLALFGPNPKYELHGCGRTL